MAVEPIAVIIGFFHRRFKRVGPNIDDYRPLLLSLRDQPGIHAVVLLDAEMGLVVAEAHRPQTAVIDIGEVFIARTLVGLAGQIRQEVVAIEVGLHGFAAQLGASLELRDNIAGASGSGQSRHCILKAQYLVRNRPGLDLARPANHEGNPNAAFPC